MVEAYVTFVLAQQVHWGYSRAKPPEILNR